MNEPIGLYLHIPFCKSRCPYCDFYTMRAGEEEKSQYVKAVQTHLGRFSSCALNTIYFGGGTPSVLKGTDIQALLRSIRAQYDVQHDCEITVECNPGSDLEEFLPAIADAGVNRISMGMQSAVDNERKKLGRIADRKRVEEAISLCRRYGIENISLDLMLGIPDQTEQSLEDSLRFCVDQGIPHVSAYLLKIEEGTVFARRRDQLNLPEEEQVCDLYRQTGETLEQNGILQYEISNFAVPGKESKHNLKYWHCEEYLGMGPSAHSFLNGERFHYTPDIHAFVNGSEPVSDGFGGSVGERLMLGLRLAEGVSDDIPEAVKMRAQEPGLKPFVSWDGTTLRLTREGFLVSNAVLSELLEDVEI